MAVGKRYAFTLVELLIVLAIVAILAMVAAPKMMESKVLSQLAQVHKEQRLLQTALDSYFQDYGGYPADQYPGWSTSIRSDWKDGYSQLTSPIQYLAKVMPDPFREPKLTEIFYTYEGESGSDESECGKQGYIYQNARSRRWQDNSCIHTYMIASVGPDHDNNDSNSDFPSGYGYVFSYSPTNGTESLGDIYKFIGDYHRASFWLDGRTLRYWWWTPGKGRQQ